MTSTFTAISCLSPDEAIQALEHHTVRQGAKRPHSTLLSGGISGYQFRVSSNDELGGPAFEGEVLQYGSGSFINGTVVYPTEEVLPKRILPESIAFVLLIAVHDLTRFDLTNLLLLLGFAMCYKLLRGLPYFASRRQVVKLTDTISRVLLTDLAPERETVTAGSLEAKPA